MLIEDIINIKIDISMQIIDFSLRKKIKTHYARKVTFKLLKI